MKKALTTLLILILAGFTLAVGKAFAEPQLLSAALMEGISGERGIELPKQTASPVSPESLEAYAERTGEVKREILRRNNATDFPVESADTVFTRFATLQAGQAAGKTFNDLIDESTPGRLPQFFLDAAQELTTP